MRLVFESGARANVTVQPRLALEPMRRFRIFAGDLYVSLDFHKNYGLMVRKGPRWAEARRAALADARSGRRVPGTRPTSVLKAICSRSVELELEGAERPLQAELASFLDVPCATRPRAAGDRRRTADGPWRSRSASRRKSSAQGW